MDENTNSNKINMNNPDKSEGKIFDMQYENDVTIKNINIPDAKISIEYSRIEIPVICLQIIILGIKLATIKIKDTINGLCGEKPAFSKKYEIGRLIK